MKFIPNAVSRVVAETALKLQKNAPTVMFVGGVVGTLGTVVLASRATLHLSDLVDESHDKLEHVNGSLGFKKTDGSTYDEKDAMHDKVVIYTQTALSVIKLYAPAALLGVASVALLAGSHSMLNKRNAALSAAYAALDKGFKEYRGRVVKEVGEDKEREIRYGVETETVTHVDPVTGKKTQETKKFATKVTEYGKLFHQGNPNWDPTPEYALIFLKGVQNMLNDKLKANGFVTLNEAYVDLGFERTQAGMVVGWVYDRDGQGDGDNYIDFGIWDEANMLNLRDYVSGREGELYLDFNVDGNIFEKVK